MMPYFCHIHNGLYVSGPDGAEGCHESTCVEFRKLDVPPLGLLPSTVPGAHNDSQGDVQYDFQKKFDKGLDAYKKARGEGLAPAATTVAAVEASHRQVKSQKRAIKKLRKMGADTSELATASGVIE